MATDMWLPAKTRFLVRRPSTRRSPHFVLLAPAMLAMAACSTLEPYRIAGADAATAAIEDDRYQIGSREYVRVLSIDRQRIDSESRDLPLGEFAAGTVRPDDEEDWIPLRAGLRKLEVEVCKYSPDFLDLLAFSGWHCGHSVLRLTSEPGSLYRLRGTADKKENRATFWVEDAVSGDTVVSPVEAPLANP